VESNPQLVQIVPPNEVVVLISFELTVNDVRGMMNLCIPFNSIERIGGKLSSNSWVAYGRRHSTPETIQSLTRNLQGSLVEVVVEMAHTRISTKELIGLRVGDIITTEKDVHTPLLVGVQGVPKFHAHAGAYKDHKAICIDAQIEPGKLVV
jgi:flagellar motor switch protein FliM